MSQAALKIKKLRPDAVLPRYATQDAAGADLAAAMDAAIVLLPGARALVPTGLAFAIPSGYEVQIRPRSGLALKHGVTVINSPGTIDADYRGEVCAILVNLGAAEYTIHPGDRVAQIVFAAVARAAIAESKDLDETDRGAGGFGSTGQ